MILEAFSTYLKQHYNGQFDPETVLHQWLDMQLSSPQPSQIGLVIQIEIAKIIFEEEIWFVGTSETGANLLESLYQYCGSYDHWQFSRWLHQVQASDFHSTV